MLLITTILLYDSRAMMLVCIHIYAMTFGYGSDYVVEVRDYSLSMHLCVKSHQWQKICSIKSPRALDCHEIRRYFSCPQ